MLPQTNFITQVKAASQTQETVERCPTQSVRCYHFASLWPWIWANTIQTSSLKPTTISSQNWRLNFSVTKNKQKRHYRIFGFVTIQEVRQEIFMKALSPNERKFSQENSSLALVSAYLGR